MIFKTFYKIYEIIDNKEIIIMFTDYENVAKSRAEKKGVYYKKIESRK
jgi:hypothetical protein